MTTARFDRNHSLRSASGVVSLCEHGGRKGWGTHVVVRDGNEMGWVSSRHGTLNLSMIARLTVLLPFDLIIREGDEMPSLDLKEADRTIRFYPPAHYADRPGAAATLMAPILALGNAQIPVFTDSQMVGGRRTAQVNVLLLDVIKSEFDRSAERISTPNPDIQAAFEFANSILARIRVYARAFQIRPLQMGHDAWQVRYITDDGRQFEHEEGKVRGLTGAAAIIGYPAVMPESIQLVADRQSTSEPYAWDHLLLDAYALLPHVGSSIVMANAALEVFITWALETLHTERQLPGEIWTWINERDHWSKEPSVSEKFDPLLQVFTGRSLSKHEPRLWQQFSRLRKARNALVHDGSAKIGSEVVTAEQAKELVDSANEIIKWVELLLPAGRRRVQTEATGPFARKMATSDEAAALGLSRPNIRTPEIFEKSGEGT